MTYEVTEKNGRFGVYCGNETVAELQPPIKSVGDIHLLSSIGGSSFLIKDMEVLTSIFNFYIEAFNEWGYIIFDQIDGCRSILTHSGGWIKLDQRLIDFLSLNKYEAES